MRHQVHVLFTWANELVRHARILDAVEQIIGPNILCWATNFFIKEPQDGNFVTWHQEAPVSWRPKAWPTCSARRSIAR